MSVPTIDFGPYLNGTQEEKEAVAKELFQAASTVGFMMLKNFHSAIGGKEKVEEAFVKVNHEGPAIFVHPECADPHLSRPSSSSSFPWTSRTGWRGSLLRVTEAMSDKAESASPRPSRRRRLRHCENRLRVDSLFTPLER